MKSECSRAGAGRQSVEINDVEEQTGIHDNQAEVRQADVDVGVEDHDNTSSLTGASDSDEDESVHLRDVDHYVPSQEQLNDCAQRLGMNLEVDKDLLWIARAALIAPLPAQWLCVESRQGAYYYNCETVRESWDRPDIDEFRQLYQRERAKAYALPTLLHLSVVSALTGEQLVSERTGASVDQMLFLPSDRVSAVQRELAKVIDRDRKSCKLQLLCEERLLLETATLAEENVVDGAVISVIQTSVDTAVTLTDATMKVTNGSPAQAVQVGSEHGADTHAQNPPDKDDTWEVLFEAESGPYTIVFRGGDNEWHGILTVEIDGVEVGDIDQYCRPTKYPTEHTLQWESTFGGRHVLKGIVKTKREASHGYWICLKEICFQPFKAELMESD